MAKLNRYRIACEDRRCQVIDQDTGEDITNDLVKLVLTITPGARTLELVYVKHDPIIDPFIEVECEEDATRTKA